jgi:hypothetical protein
MPQYVYTGERMSEFDWKQTAHFTVRLGNGRFKPLEGRGMTDDEEFVPTGRTGKCRNCDGIVMAEPICILELEEPYWIVTESTCTCDYPRVETV